MLKSTAELNGDVITGKLSIEPGARFTGTCDMGGAEVKKPNIPAPDGKQESKEKFFK